MTRFESQKKHLQKIIESDRVPHLMLFVGSKQTVHQIALDFAHAWLKKISPEERKQLVHDIHLVKVEGKLGMHSVDSIRDMLEKAALGPFQASGKVFIIEDADRMLAQSANTLLKTIEEPQAKTFFLLLSDAPEKVLPTIRSRCQILHFEQKRFERTGYYKKLHELLGKERLSLCEVNDFCSEVHKNFEEMRKELEVKLGFASKDALKEMSSEQKRKYEHELEGACTTMWIEEVQMLLCDIGFVYRDAYVKNLHDVQSGIRAGFLLEKVQSGLVQAKLAIERSTPLKNALQTFFLQLST